MLKLITLAACVVGFVLLGPKALAEFRRTRLQARAGMNDNAQNHGTADKPKSSKAA
jgi:hypothetical protein